MTALSYIARTGRSHLGFVNYLKRWLPKAVLLVPAAPRTISVALLGHKNMAALHRRFLHVSGSTDVLTFELDRDTRGRLRGGEVVVCVPYAQREAKRRGLDPRHELLLYALHGVLHLSGYDDRTAKGQARMHEAEDRILQKIGIGTVFNRAPKNRPSRSRISCKTE